MLSVFRARVAADTPFVRARRRAASPSNVEAAFAAEARGDDPERQVTAAGSACVSISAAARDDQAPRATGHRTVSTAAVKT
jgi:hypothetical protein